MSRLIDCLNAGLKWWTSSSRTPEVVRFRSGEGASSADRALLLNKWHGMPEIRTHVRSVKC